MDLRLLISGSRWLKLYHPSRDCYSCLIPRRCPYSLMVLLHFIVICWHFQIGTCSEVQFSDVGVTRNLVLSNALRVGHGIIHFGNHSGSVAIDQRSEFARYFTVDNSSFSLITANSLMPLTNRGAFLLDLVLKTPLVDGNTLERVQSLMISVVPDADRIAFAKQLYVGRLRLDAAARTVVPGLERISLKAGQSADMVQFNILEIDDDEEIDGPISDLIELVTIRDPYESAPYIQVTTRRKLDAADKGIRIFAIEATTRPTGNTDHVRVELRIDDDLSYPPVFLQRRYVTSVVYEDLALGGTVLRVQAFSHGGLQAAGDILSTITYSIEPADDIPFDVDPFTGDVFVTGRLTATRYSFDVIATEGALSSRTPVKIIVVRKTELYSRKGNNECGGVSTNESAVLQRDCDDTTIRYKRALRPEIGMTVPENYSIQTSLPQIIRLGANERIKDAPVEKQQLTVFANGTIQLNKALNYEREKLVQMMVMVENLITLEDSPQRIVIYVQDVDERPRFVDEPVPYLAVVNPDTYVGITVFTFHAVDEQGDLLDDPDGVGYQQINAGDGYGRYFKVDALGRVKTLQKTYKRGDTYQVYVQAYDKKPTDPKVKDSEIAVLNILVGERPPQFYQERYQISVPENTPIGASVAAVKAKTFDEKSSIKYDLYENTGANALRRNRTKSDAFTIDENIGVIHLRKDLDYDSGLQPRSYSLKAVASTGALTSEVPVEINLADVNDNTPVFSQPLYTATVKEDIPIGRKILQVSARDHDSGPNAAIRYYADDGNFTVDDDGVISAKHRLDADQRRQGFYLYRFTVTARDKGDPPRSATSQVQIKTKNVNDEAPVFIPTSQYTEYVAEDAQGNTPIVTIQAQDPDRDQVKYYFFDKGSRTLKLSHFDIDQDTGVIKLRDGVETEQLKQRDMYQLAVVAVDDGGCCKDLTSARHTSTATVRIGIKDVNNNRPIIRDCEGYSAKARVPEGKHKNYTIIKVEATDDDSGQNGDIVYSLYYPQGERRYSFIIEPTTGELKASPYMEFDREDRPFEDVTVKATDRGERPLIAFCHFTVAVEDINDNSPQWDRGVYEATISRSMPVGQSVLTVFADDRDAPHNARVTYELKPDLSEADHVGDIDYFSIRRDGGEIMLTRAIPAEKTKMTFLAVASDNGAPPRRNNVKVIIDVAEAAQHYPTWRDSPNCPSNITMVEDVNVNTIFVECYAESGTHPDNPISYSMRNGAKQETNSNGDFREFLVKRNGKDWVIIRNLRPLDYEKIKRYDLTVTAKDMRNGLSKDRTFIITVVDCNDNVPKFSSDIFTGQIEEEQEVAVVGKTPIVTVVARDNDYEPAFRDITYSILPGPASPLFRIDPKGGAIYALTSFDRERNDSFILDVQAEDGAISSLPGAQGPNFAITKVQIFISDLNDNVPTFRMKLYEGMVRENADVGQNVMTVKAHDDDKDSQLKYSLDPKGNHGNAFAVGATSGTIFVNDPLDYETVQEYHLTLYVTDGNRAHQASTNLHIAILDVNDNAPIFSQPLYSATMQEEDKKVPKVILQVSATDLDKDETSRNIIYRIIGQGANKEFTVNERTGQIMVNEPLDRDPPNGSEKWNFVVHAIDNGGYGLIGYADVQVTLTDVNDRSPHFEGGPHVGYVEEGQSMKDRPHGVFVMTMTATDHDDPRTQNARLIYSISGNKYLNRTTPVFSIDANTGKLYAMVELDRENPAQRQFEIEVKATDHGDVPRSGYGKAIIRVTDINDSPPYFDNARPFESTVRETAPVNFPVMSLSAKDPDDEAFDNVLQYSLVESSFGDLGTRYFYITTDPDISGSNVGTIRVKQPLDYEDSSQKPGFNLTVRVTDGRYFASAPVRLTLFDENDNEPRINPAPNVYLREDVPIGTNVTRFTATDPDLRDQERIDAKVRRKTSGSPTLGNKLWLGALLMSLLFGVTCGANINSSPLTLQIGNLMRAQNGRVQRVVVEQVRNITEAILPGPNSVLASYQAYDHRPGDLAGTNLTFRINRTTDQERQFYIGPKDGMLRVAKPLDREKVPQYRLVIEAVDEGNVGHTILVVNLEDVNDNAPELNISKIPVIPENVPPVLFVAAVTAFDRDAPENGPPFYMAVPQNSTFADKFSFVFVQAGDQGRGTMNISTKVTFDREKDGKRLEIPIYVRDSGKPPVDAIRYFPVIIGDENDNPMHDGHSVIQVYNYNKKMPVTSIGRAYVEDLDDWDIGDKTFEWKGKAPDGFTLAADGVITIDPLAYDLLPEYDLEIAVTDTKRQEQATAHVKVLIDVITETAFNNAGSIRIKNVEAEDFIRIFNGDSQYNILRQFIADKLSVAKSNVAVFSVMSEGKHPPVIQAYFAVRASPYKSATLLNGILSQNKYELEQLLGRGAQVIQVNVDDCIYESCNGGCIRLVNADIRPTVWNANETGLVGVTTNMIAKCDECAVPVVPRSCEPINPCKNGGLCHVANPGVFCECRGDFHGPFCEGRMRTFSGNSYAWLDPINPCTSLHLRFEFITTSNNALLLYDGPVSAARPGDVTSTDYIALEIMNNKPAFLLDLGHGGVFARMNLAPDVNDGQWHRIDVVLNAQDYTVTLDSCINSQMPVINGNNNQTDCQIVGFVPNDYEQLNVIEPLQIGGLATAAQAGYPPLNVSTGMDGCIRNVYINEVLQDLGSPPQAVESEPGCSGTDKICLAGLEPYCVHGLCVASMIDQSPRCACDPGYVGDRCDQKIVWRSFEQGSYTSYNFLDSMPLSPTAMSLQMIVAPRKQDGILFRGTGASGNAYVQLEMDGFQLTYRNNMGTNMGFRGPLLAEETTLPLLARLNASQPYLIEIRRELTFLKISLDGMPLPLMNVSYVKNAPLDFDRRRYYAGAQTENPQASADFQGCVAQITYDDRPIPVSQSDPQNYAVVTGQQSVSDGCPDVATCASLGLECKANYICVDFWKGPFCTCPPDLKPVFDANGIWIDCGEPTAALTLGITKGAVAAILICLLVLLILVLLLVVYSRRRRVIREPSPYSDVRENIINYAEEGGGEEDQDRYNIAPLRKPVLPPDEFRQQPVPPVANGRRPTTPPDDMDDLIRDRVRLADTDPTAPPYDELRAYADEDAISVGSLSSLSSDEEEDVDWDTLNNWGPRFRKLADLYGGQD